MEIFDKLSPFMLRARIIEVGRDRLMQVAKKLAFVLVTEDISENSLTELLRAFACPVYRCLTMSDVAKYFHYFGTKVLGFRRHQLSSQLMTALHGCEVKRVSRIPEHPKVAILGASGIGRHHANWWNMEGAQVVAFLGSDEDSIASTQETLYGMFGFAGKGYTDLQELLEHEKTDIVDVCLPPNMHFEAVKSALKANCHVLCEKPFVYDDDLSMAEMMSQTQELMTLAERRGLALGVCTQYVMAAQVCRMLYQEKNPGKEIDTFAGTLVAPTRNRPPNATWTWVDLAPHMLGVAQVLSNHGELDWNTLRVHFEERLAEASFQVTNHQGRTLSCQITTLHRDVEPANKRQIAINGDLYDIDGRLDKQQVFQMDISTPQGLVERHDMLRLLIRSYLHNHVEVPAKMARQNLEWMLKIIEAAKG